MKREIKILLCGVIFMPFLLSAQSISVSGQWDLSIGIGDLPTGMPGENINSTYENTAGDITLTFVAGGLFSQRNFRVDVRRSDTTWQSSWQLSVRRTSGGFVWGTVNGGTTYQAITTVNQQFLSGRVWFASNLPLQYQLSGVSATQAAGNYLTTIIYTLTVN